MSFFMLLSSKSHRSRLKSVLFLVKDLIESPNQHTMKQADSRLLLNVRTACVKGPDARLQASL